MMADPVFAHVVNLFSAPADSLTARAQEVTVRALRAAQEFAAGTLAVALHSAVFAEDRHLVPDFFGSVTVLHRSILDCTADHNGRRLPLLADILAGLRGDGRADYYVFTNADISPQPFFYLALARLVAQGYDGLIVTRRTVAPTYRSSRQLPLMYADLGHEHPGSDCFVFKRELVDNFFLGRVAVGAEFVALALRANLTAFARNFGFFRDLHLTFHLGDDRPWLNHTADARFNEREVDEIFRRLFADDRLVRPQALRSLYDDYLQRKKRLGDRIQEREK